MMALAGHRLGCEFVFIDPAPDACAQSLGDLRVLDWNDASVSDAFAGCDLITFDFENVPATTLSDLSHRFEVRPNAYALEVSQDRLVEKRLFRELDLPVTPFHPVTCRPELLEGLDQLGLPALLKTRRFGYDGKGQAMIRTKEDMESAWQALQGGELILEGWVSFSHECALTAVRGIDGEIAFYPLTHTLHKEGILRFALGPSPALAQYQSSAEAMCRSLLQHLDYVGCLTIEFFVTEQGLVLNEFAPRVHNSAHWTIEGAVCSQFENHLRAIMGLPLGQTQAIGHSLMLNFIGTMPSQRMLEIPRLHWHDYGKSPRAGRKVGHANWQVDAWSSMEPGVETFRNHLTEESYQWLSGLIKVAG
jgi:5-(carboxyamino)imidazole ribonucleotide synthase